MWANLEIFQLQAKKIWRKKGKKLQQKNKPIFQRAKQYHISFKKN